MAPKKKAGWKAASAVTTSAKSLRNAAAKKSSSNEGHERRRLSPQSSTNNKNNTLRPRTSRTYDLESVFLSNIPGSRRGSRLSINSHRSSNRDLQHSSFNLQELEKYVSKIRVSSRQSLTFKRPPSLSPEKQINNLSSALRVFSKLKTKSYNLRLHKIRTRLMELRRGRLVFVHENRMLELDDGEDFISDIVDELLNGTLDIIFQKYIERQLLPYTVSQARDAILTIIDWRFLACDEGEADPLTDPTWQEDEEPSPAVPDCWAQGSMPKTYCMRPPSVTSVREETVVSTTGEKTTVEEDTEKEIELDEQGKPWEIKDEDILNDEQPEPETAETVPEVSQTTNKTPNPPTKKKRSKKFKPHKGRLSSAGVGGMTESLEETERKTWIAEKTIELQSQQAQKPMSNVPQYNPMPQSVASILKRPREPLIPEYQSEMTGSDHSPHSIKLQGGRPPGSRDVYYDENGTVTSMSRINPEKLPSHRIKTKFNVVDPAVEAAQARLDAMRTGRYLAASSNKKRHAPTPSEKSGKSGSEYKSVTNSQVTPRKNYTHAHQKKGTVTPLPPPMLESMELVPGVVVREGDRVKKGPKQMQRNMDKLPAQETLRPVGENPVMTISVKELLGNTAPVVRMVDTTPVPPIVPKPPTQRRGIQT